MNSLQILDYAGVAVFAATGALAASRKQLDIVGFIFMASITGVGGGTLRDLILGITPVFWVRDPAIITICISVSLLVYLLAHLIEYRYRLLLWLDAIGLAAYCVFGAMIGLSQGVSPVIAIVMGVLTASFGGILRDVISGEVSVLLRDEIYITCALAGASVFVILTSFGVYQVAAVFCGALCAFILRAGALSFAWSMPRYKPRKGRKNT